MLSFRFSGADGSMTEPETLTSGMVGKEVRMEFTQDWDGLSKTAVFMAGEVTRSVVGVTDVVQIPAEVLATPLETLHVGVYGVAADGSVTPTIRAVGPMIRPGAVPTEDIALDPDLPIWAQLQVQIDELRVICEDPSRVSTGIYIGAGEMPEGYDVQIDPTAAAELPATQAWVTEQIRASIDATWEAGY